MARTFGAAGGDRVQAPTSASLDASDPVFSVLFEAFPTTLTALRTILSHLTAGGAGWNIRLSGTTGDIEFRQNRVTTNLSYITNDTPLSAAATWRRVMITGDMTLPSAPHIYHDKVLPGTLAEATYGTTTIGAGAVQPAAGQPLIIGNSTADNVPFQGRIGRVAVFKRILTPAEANAWFAQPRGDDPDCVAFYCLGSSSPERDFSGTTAATMNRNPGTVTTATVSSGSTLPAAYVLRSVGATARMIADVQTVQATWLNGMSLSAATGNFRYEFQLYADGTFDFIVGFVFTGFVADPWDPATDNPTKCCVLVKPAAGQGYDTSTSTGVHWRYTTVPGASQYLWDCNVPGIFIDGPIFYEYTGGAVAADATQLRIFRLDHGCLGQSGMARGISIDFNTVRPAASVIAFSFPGGRGFNMLAVRTGVGQDLVSTRNLSCAPDVTAIGPVGFWDCTADGSGGDGIRLTANGVTVTVHCRNCISIGNNNDFFNERIGGGSDGAIDADHNVSSDATSDDFGGAGHQINVAAGSQFVDRTHKDFRLAGSSAAIDAGAQNAGIPSIDLLGADYSADATPDVGAYQFAGVIASDAGFDKRSRFLKDGARRGL